MFKSLQVVLCVCVLLVWTLKMVSKKLVILLTAFFTQTEAARILAVFPIPSISHQVVFRPLVLELVKRGHEVISITTDPAYPKGETPANLTEIDLHDMSYEVWGKEFLANIAKTGIKDDWVSQIHVTYKVIIALFEKQMVQDEVRKFVFDKSLKYDLLLLEAVGIPVLGLTHLFQVPVIEVSSLGPLPAHLRNFGAPYHVFVHPTLTTQHFGEMTLWKKIAELYQYYKVDKCFDQIDEYADAALKKTIGPDTPSIKDLRKNVDMLFVNVHPLWDVNRPVPPNYIYMGGIHQKPEKPLPKELKTFLDSSKRGVIYISFGTNMDTNELPPERVQLIVEVLSKLPYDVLWKWNADELPGSASNIKIGKWFPQSDLLRHPKVKLFITQGGLQSTDEAITAGVPMIGVPMFADQYYNTELYEYHKIGKRLDLDLMTEENLYDTINTLIEDESCRKNIARLRVMMNDSPQKPLDRAVWWAEYVLRHGGAKQLRSPSANMSWSQYLELELVFYVFLGLFTVIICSVFVIYILFKRLRRYQSNKMKLS